MVEALGFYSNTVDAAANSINNVTATPHTAFCSWRLFLSSRPSRYNFVILKMSLQGYLVTLGVLRPVPFHRLAWLRWSKRVIYLVFRSRQGEWIWVQSPGNYVIALAYGDIDHIWYCTACQWEICLTHLCVHGLWRCCSQQYCSKFHSESCMSRLLH